ncbi:MAG: dCTP deaminase [Gammaproteobacteria bacterium]
MSVVSGKRLCEMLASGELFVSPILNSEQIGPASIDLRLGPIAYTARTRNVSHVSPARYRNSGLEGEVAKQQKLDRYEVPFGTNIVIHAGRLTLVPSLEWVHLPSNLLGVVTARSTWAREGLSIATATFIQPGYRGIITLELANLGPVPIELYPGMRIAQIAFFEVTGKERPNAGQFDLSFEPKAGYLKDDELYFVRNRSSNPID